MRNYDFTPLWRSTVGFDRTFDLLNNSQVLDGQDNYPPYDIARTGEESYRISLAIAGFSPDEIAITAQQNLLTVAARNPTPLSTNTSTKEFRRGRLIATSALPTTWRSKRPLTRTASCRSISCEIPEAMKPRRIEIASGQPSGSRSKPRAVSAA